MVNATRSRSRRRSAERGAAVFIVVLVIAMLSAIGIFAASAATLSTAAAGHERQMTQTHYLTEYALSLVLADLERAGSLNEVDAAWRQQLIAGTPPQCSINNTPYCFTFVPRTFENKATEEIVEPSSIIAPGSLGLADIGWSFKVELTDRFEASDVPGSDLTGGPHPKNCMVTLNARGIIWPNAVGTQTVAMATSGAQEALSAQITLPCTPQ
jgi:hypothetical protein